MAITILELAKHRGLKEDEDGSFTMGAINDVGLEIMGGCQRCGASLGCYNGCPSKSGYWMCKDDCIGDDGYATVEEANAAIFGETKPKPQTMKVWALATDGDGTAAEVFMSEMDLYVTLAERMGTNEEAETAKGHADAGDLEALKEFVCEEITPPHLFTWAMDEREISNDAAPLYAALKELVRCIRGGDKTAGVSMDDALIEADEALSSFTR